ncbi:MAG: hypothetical protein ACLTZJ_06450 [Oscillospiraceae bacterium]
MLRTHADYATPDTGVILRWKPAQQPQQDVQPKACVWRSCLRASAAPAAIGPRYCGEITIAQFAANFNRSASQLSTQCRKIDQGRSLDEQGHKHVFDECTAGRETDEKGEKRLHRVDGGAAFGARPTGLMQLAHQPAGAQKDISAQRAPT